MRRAERANPITVAVGGLLVMLLAVVSSLWFEDLPIIGGAVSYQVEFSEVGGLRSEDPVRIAGIRAGKVESVELAGDRVLVTFRVSEAWIGDRTTAAIGLETLFGAKYLALDPRGSRTQDPQVPIPLARTTSLFDVTEAFNGLSETVGDIDIDQLARSFETLAGTFRGTPDEAGAALQPRPATGGPDQPGRVLHAAELAA